jgi:hypothetical protein
MVWKLTERNTHTFSETHPYFTFQGMLCLSVQVPDLLKWFLEKQMGKLEGKFGQRASM